MGAVVLEWGQYGYFDSFDVIRSGTSMVGVAEADLPSPIATNLKSGYYVDNTATLGVTYFYMIRTWRAGVSHLSGQVEILTKEPEIPISDIVLDVIKTKGGYYFNPNYMQTMFQDIAGELPAEIGKPVGKILNIFKGEGSPTHAYAPNNNYRPILRSDGTNNYLEFTGSQGFQIDTVFPNSAKMSNFFKFESSNNGVYILGEASSDFNQNANTFYMAVDTSSVYGGGLNVASISRGSASGVWTQSAYKQITPSSPYLAITTHNITDSLSTMRVNGVMGNNGTAYKGGGVFSSNRHFIGNRGSTNLHFIGKIWAFGCFFDNFTSTEISSIESLLMP